MEYVRLGDVIHIKHGYAFKGDFFTNEETGLLVLTPANFTLKGGFQETNKFTTESGFPSEYVLHEGDLIVTMTDLSKDVDTIGYSALVPSAQNHCYLHNQRIGLVTIINNEFDKKYIYWLMRTKQYQRSIANTSNGATVHHTSPDKIYRFKCEKKPLIAQHRIASILSTYETLIENNTKRIRLLEKMAENLYKEWFVRFRFPGHEKAEMENGLPKGWEVEKVKECVKRLPFGRTYKEAEVEKEGNIIVIDQSTNEYLGFHNDEPSHNANINNPILLFGDHSCKFKLMINDFSLGENVIPFISSNDKCIDRYYLYYATYKLIKTEEYKRHWGRLCAMKILLPDYQLQCKFSRMMKRLEMFKLNLQHQNSLLARQRDLLLPRLMSCKLEVKP